VRRLAPGRRGFIEKRLFGGVGFLLNGHMCVGAWKEFLIVRVGPEAYQQALAQPHVCEFDITGRPMTGWIMVEPAGVQRESELAEWIERAAAFVGELPAK
jgi:hypothetical protein